MDSNGMKLAVAAGITRSAGGNIRIESKFRLASGLEEVTSPFQAET
jgi:hypothetical protein